MDPKKGYALGLAQRFYDGVHDPTYDPDKRRTLLAQAGICLIIARALAKGLFTDKARGREENQNPLDNDLFKEAEGVLLKRMDHVGHILHLKTQDEPDYRAIDELAKGLEAIQFEDNMDKWCHRIEQHSSEGGWSVLQGQEEACGHNTD